MANDLTLSTGNAVGPPAGTVLKTEEISSKHYDVVKVALGPAGATVGDLEGTSDMAALLTSAARTAATNSADQNEPNAKGVMLFLDVTVSGGASDTLSLKLQAKDPVGGSYADIADFGVMITGVATGLKLALLYPAADDTDFAGVKALKGNLPYTWRAVVTPSDATSWTYSLGASALK